MSDTRKLRRRLSLRRILATCAVLPWLIMARIVSGPLRWELQSSYPVWIEGMEEGLPWLTTAVALPAIGIGRPSLVGFLAIFAFWGILWLWPAIALWRIWRKSDAELPTPGLLWGFVAHAGAVVLLVVMLGFGLWLPFAAL
jgi:hypothetical protein